MSSGFEPEVRDYLRRILLSLILGVIWLMVNMTIGIFLEWMFFEGRPKAGNYIFYAFFPGHACLVFVGVEEDVEAAFSPRMRTKICIFTI